MVIMLKLKRFLTTVDYWVLIASILLVRMPVALGFRQNAAARLLFISPIIFVVIKNLYFSLHKEKWRFRSKSFYLFLFYCLLLIISFIRTLILKTFPANVILGNFLIWIITVVFGLTLFLTAKNEETKENYRRAIFISISLYFTFNFFLYIIGYDSPEHLYLIQYPAKLLSSIGITSNRILFPSASGINSFGATAGIGLVSNFVIFSQKNKMSDKFLSLVGGISSLSIILLTDSRGALAFSIATISLFLVLPKKLYPALQILPFFAPLLPLFLIFILNLLPEQIITVLSRESGDLSNVSNRLTIWNIILSELKNFKLIHLIGYGYRGQVISGLASSYAYIFYSYTSQDVATAHNFLLQNILEIGYIGAIIFLIFLKTIMSNLAHWVKINSMDYISKCSLFVLVYLLFIGITEAVLSPDYQEVFVILLLLSTSVLTNVRTIPNGGTFLKNSEMEEKINVRPV